MSQPIGINPDGLRKAANQFDDISHITQNIVNNLVAGCSGEGEPWGDDKAGKKFSEGASGYIANRDGTFKNLNQLVGIFGQNRDNLRQSATTFEQSDQTAKQPTHSGDGSGSGSGSTG
jgi:uncharacterized protein YukE